MKKIKIILIIVISIVIILKIFGGIFFLPQKSVIENISENDYKLIENEFSVSIPSSAVIESIFSESGGAGDSDLNVTLVIMEDEEEKFTSSIKLEHYLDEISNNEKLSIDKVISTQEECITYKYYKPQKGTVKIEMHKCGRFSGEMYDRLGKAKAYYEWNKIF